MSRIGRKEIILPAGVELTVAPDNTVTVKGPKGTLTQKIDKVITINKDGNTITLTRPNDINTSRALHGLSRTLIANMVEGVTKGFSKKLDQIIASQMSISIIDLLEVIYIENKHH